MLSEVYNAFHQSEQLDICAAQSDDFDRDRNELINILDRNEDFIEFGMPDPDELPPLELDSRTLNPWKPDVIKEIKISLGAIAMIYRYSYKYDREFVITSANADADAIAAKFGLKSGEKLLREQKKTEDPFWRTGVSKEFLQETKTRRTRLRAVVAFLSRNEDRRAYNDANSDLVRFEAEYEKKIGPL